MPKKRYNVYLGTNPDVPEEIVEGSENIASGLDKAIREMVYPGLREILSAENGARVLGESDEEPELKYENGELRINSRLKLPGGEDLGLDPKNAKLLSYKNRIFDVHLPVSETYARNQASLNRMALEDVD